MDLMLGMEPSVFVFVAFGFLLLWNTPIAVSLGMASLLTIYAADGPMAVFPTTMYAATAKFALLAIPFFVLAGVVMEQAGVSSRLIKFANVCVGHINGGLAIASGTSMASPHAAGGAALYLSRYRTASPSAVETAIKGSAVVPGTVSKGGQPITRLDVLPF